MQQDISLQPSVRVIAKEPSTLPRLLPNEFPVDSDQTGSGTHRIAASLKIMLYCRHVHKVFVKEGGGRSVTRPTTLIKHLARGEVAPRLAIFLPYNLFAIFGHPSAGLARLLRAALIWWAEPRTLPGR